MTLGVSSWVLAITPAAGVTALVNTAGKSLNTGTLTIGSLGSSGTVQLASAVVCGNISHVSGTLDTAGFSLTGTSFSSITASSGWTRVLSFGASTITLSGSYQVTEGTGITVNPGTSLINLTSASATYYSDMSAYNVYMSSISIGTRNIGSMTAGKYPSFNNLTLNYRTGYYLVNVNTDMTVNGLLTLGDSGSAINRTRLCSNTPNTQRTITVGTFSAGNWDFLDIVISGAGAPYSGTRLGNCGNNSGITFTTAKTVYRVGTNTTWLGSSSWALTSGGAGSNNNYPLPQDTIIFDNVFTASSLGFSSSYTVGTLDCTARTNALTISTGSNYLDLVGSFTGSSAITFTSTSAGIRAIGNSAQTFNQNSAAIGGVRFDVTKTPGSVITLGSNFLHSGTTGFILNSGTVDLGGYSLSCWRFSSSNSNTRAIQFNSGSITLTANTSQSIWDMTTSTGFTCTGTPNVYSVGPVSSLQTLQFIAGSGAGAGRVNVIVTGGAAGGFNISGNIQDLDFYYGGSGTFSGSLAASISIYGNLTLNTSMTWSTSANTAAFVGADATTKTINTNGRTIAAPISFSNTNGGGWQLLGALVCSSSTTMSSGSLDLNGFNYTGTSFALQNSPTLTFNGATISLTGTSTAWNCTGTPTVVAGTGTATVSLTNASSKIFAGNSQAYPITLNQGGTGGLTVSGSNTFNNITNTAVGSVYFVGGTTNEFLTGFNLNGTSTAARLTLSSSNSTPAILKKSTTWYMGAGSLDLGNNTNLVFTAGGGIDFLSVSYITGSTGGSTYSSDIAETATGSDSIAATQTFEVSLTDTATGTDSIAAAVTTAYNATVAESATGSDSVSATVTFASVIVETATGTDSISASFSFSSSITESATGTDSIAAGAAYSRAIAETATGTELVYAAASFRSAVAETATGTDTVAGSLAYSRTITETATGTDSVSARAAFVVSLSETSTGTDSISASLAYSRSITETATGTDSVAAAATFVVSLSESATGTDAVTPDLQIARSVSESAIGSDAVSGGLLISVDVSESGTGADTVVAELLIDRAIIESATGSDATTAGLTYEVSTSDTATGADEVSAVANFAGVVDETATGADEITAITLIYRSVDEAATGSDAVDVAVTSDAAVDESATGTDEVAPTLDLAAAVDEAATGADEVAAVLELYADVADTATGTDDVSVTLTLPADVTESAAGADEVAVTLTLPGTIAEAAAGADTVSVVLGAVGLVDEQASGADSADAALDAVVAVSETASGADTLAVTLTLPVAVAETGAVSDASLAALDAVASVTEAASGADVVSVTVAAYPAIAETAGITDLISAGLLYLSSVDEAATGADVVEPALFLSASVVEAGTGTDSVVAALLLDASVIEAAAVADLVVAGNVIYVTLSELATLSDVVACNYLWNPIDDTQTPNWAQLNDVQTAGWQQVNDTQTPSWQNIGNSTSAGWQGINDTNNPDWQDIQT